MKWITRVPATLNEVKRLYQTITPEQMQESAKPGYRYMEIESNYGGVQQRWLVVFSEAAYRREEATFRKQLAQKREQAERELRQLGQQEFSNPEAAYAAVAALEKQWSFHSAKVQLEEVSHYERPGRPKKCHPERSRRAGQKPESIGWRIVGHVVKREDAIEEARRSKGKFVLATNELNEKQLPADTLLMAYKGQGGKDKVGR